jgi:hypothetical protein
MNGVMEVLPGTISHVICGRTHRRPGRPNPTQGHPSAKAAAWGKLVEQLKSVGVADDQIDWGNDQVP